MEWARKGEERALAHRKMIEAVLKHPDNEPEKALQKSLRVSPRVIDERLRFKPGSRSNNCVGK